MLQGLLDIESTSDQDSVGGDAEIPSSRPQPEDQPQNELEDNIEADPDAEDEEGDDDGDDDGDEAENSEDVYAPKWMFYARPVTGS